ncbi:MAG TPA: sulfurtransferase [Candidatus Limnocylindria bacterium]|nr:sulfurtransferase [Candidatus Limnocylindria bacterium]
MALISVDDFNARLGHERLRICDVRWYLNKPGGGRAAYDLGHIPGAIFLDLDTDLADMAGYGAPGRHPLPSVQAFRQRMESSGIGSDSLVVAYDDMAGVVAARLWWMLDNLGHRGGVAVLDGGMNAWVEQGLPLSTDEPHYAPQSLELKNRWTNVISRDELAGRLGQLTLLDSRAGERYRGEVEPVDPVAGHIPTAISAPTMANVDGEGRFLDQPALIARFAGLLNDGRPTVMYCGSGTNACHNVLAMRLAGLPDPTLYVGSYSDWSRSGMPTEK